MNLKQSTPTFTEETLEMLNNGEKHANSAHCCSPVANPICSIVNLVAVRSVLFFYMEVIIWVYSWYLAWLRERQLWGTLVICINARLPLWTTGSPPDGMSFN